MEEELKKHCANIFIFPLDFVWHWQTYLLGSKLFYELLESPPCCSDSSKSLIFMEVQSGESVSYAYPRRGMQCMLYSWRFCAGAHIPRRMQQHENSFLVLCTSVALVSEQQRWNTGNSLTPFSSLDGLSNIVATSFSGRSQYLYYLKEGCGYIQCDLTKLFCDQCKVSTNRKNRELSGTVHTNPHMAGEFSFSLSERQQKMSVVWHWYRWFSLQTDRNVQSEA